MTMLQHSPKLHCMKNSNLEDLSDRWSHIPWWFRFLSWLRSDLGFPQGPGRSSVNPFMIPGSVLLPRKTNGWNSKMEVWKSYPFHFGVIFRFQPLVFGGVGSGWGANINIYVIIYISVWKYRSYQHIWTNWKDSPTWIKTCIGAIP